MSNVVVGQIPHNVIMRSNLLRRDNPPYEVYTPQHLLYNLKNIRKQNRLSKAKNTLESRFYSENTPKKRKKTAKSTLFCINIAVLSCPCTLKLIQSIFGFKLTFFWVQIIVFIGFKGKLLGSNRLFYWVHPHFNDYGLR